MKAIIEIELSGEDVRQHCKLLCNMTNELTQELGDLTFGRIPPSGWVAEITGYDSKYKYKRTFLKRKIDYSRSNLNGSQRVMAEYLLESGRFYEVKHRISNKNTERYFCKVNDDGDIIKIDESELAKAFNYPESYNNNHAVCARNNSTFYPSLGITIDGMPTDEQMNIILQRMTADKNKILKCLKILIERIPVNDLVTSLDTGKYLSGLGLNHMQTHIWNDMNYAIIDYNLYADILKADKITQKFLSKAVKMWQKSQSESMSSQQPGNE